MKPDELLDRAARSLRDQTRQPSQSGDQTLSQVLATLRTRRRRRRIVLAAMVPFGTLFFGLAGWAMVTGRWSPFLPPPPAAPSEIAPHKEVVRPIRRRPAIPPKDLAPGNDEVATPPSEPVAAPVESLPPPASRTVALAPTAVRPGPRAVKTAPPAPPEATPPAAAATVREPSADDELYRQAHEAHFARRDYAAALVAWNRYVMLGPKARFFIEARYNRAIALVHLDRKAEAAEALRPFADSPPGSYRRSEARDLLRHLGVPAAAVP